MVEMENQKLTVTKIKGSHKNLRKSEQIKLAIELNKKRERNSLEDIFLIHNCLPETNLIDIDFSTQITGLSLASPIIINAITGGSEEGERINQSLARIAKNFGLAMAVGSQSIALEKLDLDSSFKVTRETYEEGVIFANVGASASPELAEQAVKMVKANALQIHLNPAQEVIMPEGEKNFQGYFANIKEIVDRVSVPVIIKEVGFGIAKEQAGELARTGVKAIDVGGKGGTNFAKIEAARRKDTFGENFFSWGIPTAVSIVETWSEVKNRGIDIIASGGIRSGVDCVKALVLGAKAVGIAGYFLTKLLQEGEEGLIREIEKIHQEIKAAMLFLGVTKVEDLVKKPVVIIGKTAEWLKQRGIDINQYAQRKG